jgi:uncharacterized lipoprotein YddW (UPF0748 family)
MRRTLSALVLFSATLFILQNLPQRETVVVTQTIMQGGTVGEWGQTTVADFERGELDCLAITATEDGEILLGEEQGGQYCATGTFISEIHQASLLFNVVGPGWSVEKPMGTAFQVEIRVSRDKETWTEWLEVSPDEDGPGTEEMTYGNLLEVSTARYIQYRLSLGTFETSASPVLHEVAFTMMNTRDGPTTDEARAMILPQEVTSGVPQPRIISRRGWGANESLATREPVYRKPVAFVIHHTVTSNNPEDPAQIVRAILQYHAITRGWGDIGYNYLIDRQGNIYEGRKGGDGVVGIHAGDYNYGSVGIALLGDYRSAEMTPAMKDALVSLMAWEADRFGIHPLESSFFIHRDFPHILGHRDLWSTVCPGDKVYKLLPELRELTWQRLLAHNPRVVIDSPEAGEAVSGETEIRVSSPSPATARTQLFVDGTMQVEGEPPLVWTWNTRQLSEGRHRIEGVATSIQGRTSRVVHEVTVDNTPPTGSLAINDGASYTSQYTVTLTLEGEDERGEVADMQFTQDNASEFSEVEEFATARQWVLTPGEGEKTIGVRFLDEAGNVSVVYTDSISLDTEPPSDWDLLRIEESGAVLVSVSDNGSLLDPSSAAYSVSTDGGTTWGEWNVVSCDEEDGETPLQACRLSVESVSGAARFKIADRAGNEGHSPIYGQEGSPVSQDTPSPTPDASAMEARALWVPRWSYSNKADVQTIVDKAASANFNILLFQVRGQGDAYYQSQYEPWADRLSGTLGQDPGWDPLAVAIQEAHDAGLQVHAHVNVYPVWLGTVPPRANAVPKHMYHRFNELYGNEWVQWHQNGTPMELNSSYLAANPGHPAVSEHIIDVCRDIVQNYDIDGLHLDYIRYSSPYYSYDPVSQQRFEEAQPIGWADWQRAQITELVSRLYDEVIPLRPNTVLSAAAWPIYQDKWGWVSYGSVKYDGYDGYYQDSRGWLEMGKTDFLAPMLYGTSVQNHLNRFEILVEDFVAESHGRHIYAGIAAGYSSFSEIESRINIARKAGAQGQAIFAYSLVESNDYWDDFREGPYAQPAQLPSMPWKVSSGPTPTPIPMPSVTPTPTVEVPPSPLPDLVVDKIVVAPDTGLDSSPVTVTVAIRNCTGVEVQNGFWVELFVDPSTVPGINSIAGQGAFWYVPSLGAQETLTLAPEDADPLYSTFEGRFSSGRHELYAYVDVYHTEGEVGLVSELDEANNLLGPLIVEIKGTSDENSWDPTSPFPTEALRLFVERLQSLLSQLRRFADSLRS